MNNIGNEGNWENSTMTLPFAETMTTNLKTEEQYDTERQVLERIKSESAILSLLWQKLAHKHFRA